MSLPLKMADSETKVDNKSSPNQDKLNKKQKFKDLRKKEKKEKKEKKRAKKEQKKDRAGRDGEGNVVKKEKKEDKYKREKEKRLAKKRKREEEANRTEPDHPSKKRSFGLHADDGPSKAGYGDTSQTEKPDIQMKSSQQESSDESDRPIRKQPSAADKEGSQSTASHSKDKDKEGSATPNAEDQQDTVKKSKHPRKERSLTPTTEDSEDDENGEAHHDNVSSAAPNIEHSPSSKRNDQLSQHKRSLTPNTESLEDSEDGDERPLKNKGGVSISDNIQSNGDDPESSPDDTQKGPREQREPLTADNVEDITKNVKFKLVEDVGEWGPAVGKGTFDFFVVNSRLIPLAVFAPGLDAKAKLKFDAYTKPRQQPANRSERTPWAQELLLHNDDHPTLDYVAREEPSAGVQSHLRDYIGIYDPATGECQVIPARRLILRSHLKSARGDQEKDAQDANDNQDLTVSSRS